MRKWELTEGEINNASYVVFTSESHIAMFMKCVCKCGGSGVDDRSQKWNMSQSSWLAVSRLIFNNARKRIIWKAVDFKEWVLGRQNQQMSTKI